VQYRSLVKTTGAGLSVLSEKGRSLLAGLEQADIRETIQRLERFGNDGTMRAGILSIPD